MKRITSFGFMLLTACFLMSAFSHVAAQRRNYRSSRMTGSQQYERRIDALEQRMAALERQLGRRPQNEAAEITGVPIEKAEQLLATSQQRFQFSDELFRKGYISKAELDEHRFAMERAAIVVRLALARKNSDPTADIANEIRLFEAEHNLEVAQTQLQLAKRISTQGFIRPGGLEAHQQAVNEAQEHLERVKASFDVIVPETTNQETP